MLKHKPMGPLALGIHWAHDASVALCSPQGVLFSVAEERINRTKHYFGFPQQSIELALKSCGITAQDIDIVAFSTNEVFYPEVKTSYVVSIDGSRKKVSPKSFLKRQIYGRAEQRAMRRSVKASWGEFAHRHYSEHSSFLKDLGFFHKNASFYYVAHHLAHAASAFRLSGLSHASVITADGKGDGLSGTIYRGHEDGRLELLRQSTAPDSLGSFYQAVTEALGFTPVDGEYKTMGLAPFGKGEGVNPFDLMVSVENGILKSSMAWTFRDYNKYNPLKKVPNPLSSVAQVESFQKILATMTAEDFAFYAQEHFENNILNYARDAMTLAQSTHLVGAGGALLNVKANSRIRDVLQPKEFFVFPDSSDSGLAAGAALEALYQHGAMAGPVKLTTPYLGHEYSTDQITKFIDQLSKDQQGGTIFKIRRSTVDDVASAIEKGNVIGNFQGRLEMGPRALGNRSVLADPRHPHIKDRINAILKGREWFVPFAPALLKEDASRYWDGPTDYKYMTFAVKASDYAMRTVPGVVHVDGTLRPQVVTENDNSYLYHLLKAFKRRTGEGILINTSFNRHGLPIVGSPEDALDHLRHGWIDCLSIGEWLVEKGP